MGIAFEAGIGGVRMLDGDVTDAVEARSLGLNNQHIHIYSARQVTKLYKVSEKCNQIKAKRCRIRVMNGSSSLKEKIAKYLPTKNTSGTIFYVVPLKMIKLHKKFAVPFSNKE